MQRINLRDYPKFWAEYTPLVSRSGIPRTVYSSIKISKLVKQELDVTLKFVSGDQFAIALIDEEDLVWFSLKYS